MLSQKSLREGSRTGSPTLLEILDIARSEGDADAVHLCNILLLTRLLQSGRHFTTHQSEAHILSETVISSKNTEILV